MCYKYKAPAQQDAEEYFKAEYEQGSLFPDEPVNGFAKPLMPIIIDEMPGRIIAGEWGLIPFFGKEDPQAFFKKTNTLNAKVETADTLRSFKNYLSNRCLVIADSFYEWKHVNVAGKLQKLPYKLSVPGGRPFAMAGIYSVINNTPTYTILTTEANELMADIHNSKKRMPVVLCPEEEKLWLNRNETNLEPYHRRTEIELIATPLFTDTQQSLF